jgi:hypothetical protein
MLSQGVDVQLVDVSFRTVVLLGAVAGIGACAGVLFAWMQIRREVGGVLSDMRDVMTQHAVTTALEANVMAATRSVDNESGGDVAIEQARNALTAHVQQLRDRWP